MRISQFLPMILFLALFALYWFWMLNKRKKGAALAGPAWRKFFERTGYKYSDLEDQALEHQVDRALATFGKTQQGGGKVHLIRDFHSAPIHWVQSSKHSAGGWSSSMCWMLPLDQPPRLRWHVAEKSLAGAGKAVKEALSSVERHWKPICPNRIKSGDAELDKRFRIYGEDEQAARQILQTPGLKEQLLSNTEVDLAVDTDRVVFNDPGHKNLHAAQGGTIGLMANAGDPVKWLDLQTPVHDRIAELLASCASASR